MATINIYWVPNDSHINSEYINICKGKESISEEIDRVFSDIKSDESIINFCFVLDEMANNDNRVGLLLTISDYAKSKNIEGSVIQYFALPSGGIVKINKFELLLEGFWNLIDNQLDDLMDKYSDLDLKTDMSKLENEIGELSKNGIKENYKEIVSLTVKLGFIYSILDKYIEENKEEIQDDFNIAIKKTREDAIEEEEIKTELDMVNSCIKRIIKDKKEFENEEFVRCIYNQHEMDQVEMIEELSSHYVPEWMPRVKDINDTLDDEYEIETTHLIISRDVGGALHIKRK
jgi:hypothetical protein